MTTAYFDSLDACDIIEVQWISPDDPPMPMRLFVDSGFTGASCFVLPEAMRSFALATIASSRASGALRGQQTRILLTCRIPALSFQRNLIAITTDVSPLSLPPSVDGMVGLSFLRLFTRWGAEQTQDGGWRFYLSEGNQ